MPMFNPIKLLRIVFHKKKSFTKKNIQKDLNLSESQSGKYSKELVEGNWLTLKKDPSTRRNIYIKTNEIINFINQVKRKFPELLKLNFIEAFDQVFEKMKGWEGDLNGSTDVNIALKNKF